MRNPSPFATGWFQNGMRSARQSAPHAPIFKGKQDSDGILGLQEISATGIRERRRTGLLSENKFTKSF